MTEVYALDLDGLCRCGCGEKTNIAKRSYLTRGIVKGGHYLYLPNHHRRKSPVEYIEDENGCWIWQRSRTKNGYGKMGNGGVMRLAHRVVYERHLGPIPEGKVVDHLCRNKACVNPAHLEVVTQSENVLRGERWS